MPTSAGSNTYKVYSDAACSKEVASAGTVSVSGEVVPASEAKTLAPGSYFWQASCSTLFPYTTLFRSCGAEVETVTAVARPTTLTTTLSGGGKSGATISV